MMIFTGISILTCLINIAFVIYLIAGLKKIKQISKLPVINDEPAVVIIIAVRNEEQDLEKALQSVCHINYSNYRIIVVNDRSTDRTADILKKFITNYPKLSVTTIDTLPPGWLGKNNALYQGYKNSDEEWMLFADADIVFHPDALSKAVGYAVKQKLDHLTILPQLVSPSAILNSVLATFSIMLMVHMRPWDAKNPKSNAFASIGAFNLLRRSAYEKVGTHARIKLRPDDDLQLGQIIKSAGLNQDVLAGNGYICLEWYKNLRQFGHGILKNSFAIAEYNLGKALVNALSMLLSFTLPLPILFIFGSTEIRLIACVIFLFLLIYMTVVLPNKWWYAFMIPFAGLYISYFTLKSAWITLKQGGIYWRDSFYSLAMLKGKD
jgi:glycosyltransferase involved in cell wall biosynthesis